MLGLTLREEFRGKRLKGTAIELSNDQQTGATQVAAKQFLEITYPTHDLLKGLAAVDPADNLVIIEDDDWYAPDWLTTVAAELQHAELVGEHRARYYNVQQRRGRQLVNTGHASLCSTAMRGSALLDFADACRSRPKFIDLELWRRPRDRRLFGGHRVVGIKGLPGRGGIGMGHDAGFKGEADPTGALLRDWIGCDEEAYR